MYLNDDDMQLGAEQPVAPPLPMSALRHIIGEIHYGGRVTDDADSTVIRSLLLQYFSEEAKLLLDTEKRIFDHQDTTLDNYKAILPQICIADSPEVYGLHSNAELTLQRKETNLLMDTMIAVQPRGVDNSTHKLGHKMTQLIQSIQSRLPAFLDIKLAHKSTMLEDNLNPLGNFLQQEITCFNKLLNATKNSLAQLQSATKGLILMSPKLEEMMDSMLFDKVPTTWQKLSYPSLKGLESWVDDLCERVAFIRQWLEHGPPPSYWLSSFFFPQVI